MTDLEQQVRDDETVGAERPHALTSILGPAFVAAVAYVDPGNVAANITSGARYGYLLVFFGVKGNGAGSTHDTVQRAMARVHMVHPHLPSIAGHQINIGSHRAQGNHEHGPQASSVEE